MCNFSCRSVCRLTVWNHKFWRRLPRENRQRPKNTNTHTLTSKKKLFFQHSGAFVGFSVRMKARGGNRPRRYAEQQQKQQPLLDERRCQAMRAPINRTDRVHEKRNGTVATAAATNTLQCRKCAWKIKCRLMLLSSYSASNEIPIMFSLVAHSHLLVLSWHKCLPVPVRSHRSHCSAYASCAPPRTHSRSIRQAFSIVLLQSRSINGFNASDTRIVISSRPLRHLRPSLLSRYSVVA